MKRYLIINHYFKGTYQTDLIEKQDLIDLKKGDMDLIIDTWRKGSFYDNIANMWKEIKEE